MTEVQNKSVELSPFEQVLDDYRSGRAVVIVDDAERENEGDICVATEKITPELVNFMLRYGRGLMCVSISHDAASRLNIPLQVIANNSPFNTPFGVSIDHAEVADRGATAAARAHTMRSLVDPASSAEHFVSPGHVFPLLANPRGVLGRRGQTEGSFDLARIAGLTPSGVVCEILAGDGTMARGRQLTEFAALHGLSLTSIEQIAAFRVAHDVLVRKVASSELSTDYGRFSVMVFEDEVDGKEHLALTYGDVHAAGAAVPPLVRVHSECLTGDVFESRRCDCGEQLSRAMKQIVSEGAGVVLYLRQEGRGIGLGNKLRAYALQDLGDDTVEANHRLGFKADERDFAVAAKILGCLELRCIRLVTNNPTKYDALAKHGIDIAARVPVVADADEFSRRYLDTKRDKLGHWL